MVDWLHYGNRGINSANQKYKLNAYIAISSRLTVKVSSSVSVTVKHTQTVKTTWNINSNLSILVYLLINFHIIRLNNLNEIEIENVSSDSAALVLPSIVKLWKGFRILNSNLSILVYLLNNYRDQRGNRLNQRYEENAYTTLAALLWPSKNCIHRKWPCFVNKSLKIKPQGTGLSKHKQSVNPLNGEI